LSVSLWCCRAPSLLAESQVWRATRRIVFIDAPATSAAGLRSRADLTPHQPDYPSREGRIGIQGRVSHNVAIEQPSVVLFMLHNPQVKGPRYVEVDPCVAIQLLVHSCRFTASLCDVHLQRRRGAAGAAALSLVVPATASRAGEFRFQSAMPTARRLSNTAASTIAVHGARLLVAPSLPAFCRR
jgi:hypothetical protein